MRFISTSTSSSPPNPLRNLNMSLATFCIKVKYSKTTLFLPVTPTTTYATVKQDFIAALLKSSTHQSLPDSVDFSLEDLAKDENLLNESVGLFFGSRKDEQSDYVFQKVEDKVKASADSITVAKMGLKEGKEETVYVGFKGRNDGEISKPIVQEPSLLDDEEEEDEDSNGMPSPPQLDDGEDVIMEDPKGKRKDR